MSELDWPLYWLLLRYWKWKISLFQLLDWTWTLLCLIQCYYFLRELALYLDLLPLLGRTNHCWMPSYVYLPTIQWFFWGALWVGDFLFGFEIYHLCEIGLHFLWIIASSARLEWIIVRTLVLYSFWWYICYTLFFFWNDTNILHYQEPFIWNHDPIRIWRCWI